MTSRKAHHKEKKHSLGIREEAVEASRRGEHDLALRRIEQAIEAGPGNARTWHEKGNLLAAAGDDAAAEEAWRRASELRPTYADPLEALARSRAAVRDWGEALPAAERCLAADDSRTELAQELERWRRAAPAPIEVEPELEPLVLRFTGRTPWKRLATTLESAGCVALPGLIDKHACTLLGQAAFPDVNTEPLRALTAELYAGLAPLANAWSRDLGRGEPFAPRLEQHEDHGGFADARVRGVDQAGALELERLAHELPVAASGPGPFLFEVHLLLGPERAEVRLHDTGPGGRKKPRRMRLEPGDAAIVAAPHRTMRIGGALGLLPVQAELVASAPARLLTLAW